MVLRKPEHVQQARALQKLDPQDQIAIVGELIAMRHEVLQRGPWETYPDIGNPRIERRQCYYCGCNQGDPHESNCTWLEFETI